MAKVYLDIPDDILWPSHHDEKGRTIWMQYGFVVEYGTGEEDEALFCIHYAARPDANDMPVAWMPVGRYALPSAADYPFSIRDYYNLAEQGYIDRIAEDPDQYRMAGETGSGGAFTPAVSAPEGPESDDAGASSTPVSPAASKETLL